MCHTHARTRNRHLLTATFPICTSHVIITVLVHQPSFLLPSAVRPSATPPSATCGRRDARSEESATEQTQNATYERQTRAHALECVVIRPLARTDAESRDAIADVPPPQRGSESLTHRNPLKFPPFPLVRPSASSQRYPARARGRWKKLRLPPLYFISLLLSAFFFSGALTLPRFMGLVRGGSTGSLPAF